MRTLYTIEDTARMLHLTVAGLRTLRHKNEGPVGLKIGRRVLWTQESIDRFVHQLQADADRQRESVHASASDHAHPEDQTAVR